MKQPSITVGVMAETEINFLLSGNFLLNSKALDDGAYSAKISNRQIILKQKGNKVTSGKEIVLFSNDVKSSFELKDVTIGVGFHWEQKENQKFRGALKLIVEGDKVRAINIVDLEDYLTSVISSEMSATSSLNLLKAHAIISRSWLLAQADKSKSLNNSENIYQSSIETEDEIIRWYVPMTTASDIRGFQRLQQKPLKRR